MPAADPLMTLNVATGQHRIVLKDGDPVEDDSPTYQCLTMLYEAPGWIMEETPREGSLKQEFEETGQNTPSQFKAAVERRCEPMIQERVLVSAECTSVTQETRTDGTAVYFNLLYKAPGEPAREAPIAIGS